MAESQIKGIVLRYIEYRDSARMVTLLTPEGRLDAAAHGAHKSASPLFAATQFLTYGDYVVSQRGERRTLRSASLLDGYLPLRAEPERAVHASYCAGLALIIAQPEQDASMLMQQLLSAMAYFAYSDKAPSAVTAYFILQAMAAAGYRPNLHICPHCGRGKPFSRFDPKTGDAYCAYCAPEANIPSRAIDWMRACLELTDRPERLLDYPEQAEAAMRLLLPYCRWQLDTEIKAAALLPY